MSEVTARDIKIALAKKHKDEFFLTEVKNGPTHYSSDLLIFDAVAIYKSWAHPKIVGYEIKVSRSDFLRDSKYSLYLPYFHEFYFVVPSGMVQRQEIEENIGLIWYNPATGSLTTKKKAVYRDIQIDAAMLLYIIMNRLDNERIPFYSSRAEHWKDWLANKISNRELAWNVKSKLLTQICELEQKLEEYEYSGVTKRLEEYEKLLSVMRRHGISLLGDRAQKLDEALSRAYPTKFDDAFDHLEYAVRIINEVRAQVAAASVAAGEG